MSDNIFRLRQRSFCFALFLAYTTLEHRLEGKSFRNRPVWEVFAINPVKYNDTEEYAYMTLFGTEGVYSKSRIQASSLPDGFYRYELSSDKHQRFALVQSGHSTRHAGDFISKTPLDLGDQERCSLSDQDWTISSDRKFNFESFWGHKLSIDRQISNAVYKRDLAMGKTPGGHEARLSETVKQEHTIVS